MDALPLYKDNAARVDDIVILQKDNSQEVKEALLKIKGKFVELINWIDENIKKTPKTLSMRNFLSASVPYLTFAINNTEVQALAFSTRNLYEIHLWARYTRKSPDNLKKWLIEEGQKDHLDILKSTLEMCVDPIFSTEREALEEAIKNKIGLLNKNNITLPKKNLNSSDLAAELDKKSEYGFVYKNLSKLLHPTSYLVNSSPEEIQNLPISHMLLTHLQLCAWDIHDNIKKELQVN